MPSFSRQALYDLVWSEPVKTLAGRFKISDVALAKTCRRAAIPLPERGYWAKLKAGKRVVRVQLPPRAIGASDEVEVAPGQSRHWYGSRVSLDDPEPTKPTFPDDMDDIVARARSLVGKVSVPRTFERAHQLVVRLLAQEASRIAARKASPYSWPEPYFESAFEQRRLRILNALFLSFARAGAQPSLRDKEARAIGVTVGSQYNSLTLDRLGAKRDRYQNTTPRNSGGSDVLQLGIPAGEKDFIVDWKDEKGRPLESQLTDIVVVLIVQGERNYRQSALSHYEWVLNRRQEMRDEIQRKLEERERLKQECRIRREKQRIRGLLRQAMDFRKASDIRGFVEHIRVLHHVAETEPSDFLVWTNWASEQADKIDPLKNGQLLAHMKEAMDDDEIEFFDTEDEKDEIEG